MPDWSSFSLGLFFGFFLGGALALWLVNRSDTSKGTSS